MRILRLSLTLLLATHQATGLSLGSRRSFLDASTRAAAAAGVLGGGIVSSSPDPARAAGGGGGSGDFASLLGQVRQARDQLKPIPKLIEDGKWDSVRAVLLEPPLADCWAKTNRPLLAKYAEALGDKGGDELEALEAKEEILNHLRYLDM